MDELRLRRAPLMAARAAAFRIGPERGAACILLLPEGPNRAEAEVQLRRRNRETNSTATQVAERPFLEEMRAVEALLPIAPEEINRRVLNSKLDDGDLAVAERLNAMNLRYYNSVVRPVFLEWRREVRARRIGQACGFAAACAALVAGCFVQGTPAFVLFFVGTFGFCTAIAAWYGTPAARAGARLATRLSDRVPASRPDDQETR